MSTEMATDNDKRKLENDEMIIVPNRNENKEGDTVIIRGIKVEVLKLRTVKGIQCMDVRRVRT